MYFNSLEIEEKKVWIKKVFPQINDDLMDYLFENFYCYESTFSDYDESDLKQILLRFTIFCNSHRITTEGFSINFNIEDIVFDTTNVKVDIYKDDLYQPKITEMVFDLNITDVSSIKQFIKKICDLRKTIIEIFK